jgi:hypothetical protein
MSSGWPPEVPDPVAAMLRLMRSRRLGPRKRAALLLVLEGLGYRAAARAVGLADHMALHRTARRMGLRRIHNDRARFREAMHKLAKAQAILIPQGAKRCTTRGTLRALSLATDAATSLGSVRTY